MGRLSVNLGLALGLVVALLFGVLRVQSLIHNYGTNQWNAGYTQAVGEFKAKQLQADNGQLQANLSLAKQQAQDNARGLSDYAQGMDSLHATVAQLRSASFGASGHQASGQPVPSTAATAASVYGTASLTDNGLVSVPRADLIQHAENCDADREALILGQGWAHSITDH